MSFNINLLPDFSAIDITQVKPTIENIIHENREKLKELLAQKESYTWDNLMAPLEELSDALSKAWSPIAHLHAVKESEELREVYNATQPLLTEYHTELSQNTALYNAILSIAQSLEFSKLNAAQRRIIENDIRDFKLSGVHLSDEKKNRLAELFKELTQLSTKFSENLLDATNAWTLHIEDENKISGLPAQIKKLAIDNAKRRNLSGYVFTLDFPSYSTAVKFLDNRELRKKLYQAYVTRASDEGEHAGKWDNTGVMEDILKVRHEIAQLVGFQNYAQYSLATKMAKTPDEVLHFLQDLLKRSRPIAQHEFKELFDLAKELDGLETLEAWDVAYYSEKLQKKKFEFNEEDVRPYFPINKVLPGMFAIMEKIYGIKVQEEPSVKTWHPDAKFFSLYDSHNTLRAGFYIDLYARPHKRDGAWMDECRARIVKDGNLVQYPVAYLTCNFMPPVGDDPALLTHDDVLTLFHEFGHCLHHMLTQVDYPAVGGINGVAWDAVEFPSQFMEYFCWEKESLALIAEHYKTREPLPDALFKKLIAAKHFQTGLQMVRQLEFSLFDFKLHLKCDPTKTKQVQVILDEVREETAILAVPTFNRFQHSFAHIFAGGYAAGYYSYKWAEVLSADAYSKFEEDGIFNSNTGQLFMQTILEVGGTRDPMDSFIAFRGREPKIDALLRHSGMTIT